MSPVLEFVFTKTPKFYFVGDLRANRYEIEVYDLVNSRTVYSYKGAGTCNSGYCYLQPTTKLKFFDYFFAGGVYQWRIRARIEGIWETEFSDWAQFWIQSKGFTSTFDSNMNKWNEANGTWSLTKGFLKTHGIAHKYASVFHREYFTDFDYTVVMKRKNNANNTSGVIICGFPYTAGIYGDWYFGLYFQYANNGNWSLNKFDDGSFMQYVGYSPTSAIKPYDWNKLRIVHSYPFVDLWINGTYLGWISLPEFGIGVVGIDMYRSSLPKEPLLVDKAELKVIQYPPFTDRDPAMQLGLEPIEIDVDPNRLPFLPAEENPTGNR